MDIQISVFLLFVLVPAGHSLRCYCNDTISDCEQTACDESSSCFTAEYFGDNTTVRCFLSNPCSSGSINFGMMNTSIFYWDTDLYNTQNVIDPSNNTSHGMTCYYCDEESCSNTVNCSGTEDCCIIETGIFKVCVSKSICSATTLMSLILNLTCCEGNLCDGDNITQSITQSTTQSSTSMQSSTQSSSATQSSTSMQSSTQSSSATQSTTQSSTSMQSSTQSSSANQSTMQSWSSTTNNANSIPQNFLFLCCYLLSFILLH